MYKHSFEYVSSGKKGEFIFDIKILYEISSSTIYAAQSHPYLGLYMKKKFRANIAG